MAQLTAPNILLPHPKTSDPRMFEVLGQKLDDSRNPLLLIVGFPCDQGVMRNNGRVGANKAPDAIREFFYRLAPDTSSGDAFMLLAQHTMDAGNIVLSELLEGCQELLAQTIAPYIRRKVPIIVLGGGHETSYGHFLGYVEAHQSISIFNIDAHPDVRELVDGKGHSGSAFRQALLHPSGLCQKYNVAGLLPHAVSKTHVDFVRSKGGQTYFRHECAGEAISNLIRSLRNPSFVSFDLDVVDQAFAPGVSSPACDGMYPRELLEAAFEAGRNPYVCSIDVVEVNPAYDRDGQTARLAALTVWHFMRGLCQRKLL